MTRLMLSLITAVREKPWLRRAFYAAIAYYYLKRQLTKRSVSGKVVLITGGASGIGREMAFAFAKRGAKVVLWDVDVAGLERTQKDVEQAAAAADARGDDGSSESSVVYTDQVDVSNSEAVYAAADRVRAAIGHVDVLVNNAGIISGAQLCDIPDERIKATMKVNVLAHFWTVKAFLPEMLRQNDGHIVTIASAAGLFGSPRMVDYCASKHAAVGLNEALRMELKRAGKTGVATTLMCPAHIKTELFKGYSIPYPWNVFMPSLEPQDVAARVVGAVEHRDAMVCLPFAVNLAIALKWWMPCHISDKVMEPTFGAMDKFISIKSDRIMKQMS